MNEDEKALLKAEIRLETQEMFHEQDKRILEILDTQKQIQAEHKELMGFMKEQQTKGNGYIEKFIWLIVGAFISIGASFLFKR